MAIKKAPQKTTQKSASASAKSKDIGRIVVQNVNVPGYVHAVDATMYAAMKKALLAALPAKPPGLTQAEMFAAVVTHLSEDLFPGGSKAGWWAKTVQLDLEAKGQVVREATKPLRWRRTTAK
jgi:hypothetical protein